MKVGEDGSSDDRTEAFIELLAQHDRVLSIYVTGLVGSPQDAQDLLQEGKVVMWRHFDQFELGTNFVAWARRVLFHQVLAYRRRKKKEGFVTLSEETFALVDEEAKSQMLEKKWLRREEALESCIEKLDEDKKDLVRWRYRDELSIEKVSQLLKKEEGSVYRALSRVRRALFECVERAMQNDEEKEGVV